MADPVARRDPKDLLREAMRLADDYYDLAPAQCEKKLAQQRGVLNKQLQKAEAMLPRETLRGRKAQIADERYILERIENLYRTFHKDPDAGPDQAMSKE